MKASEIRSKSRQEILDEIDASRRELLNIRFQWQAGETRNPAQRKDIRRNIARLETILREMDLGINKHLKAKE
ncbi:MAG: 50S ribosomal protein L29 [Candidatus Brocadia sp.]